MGGGVYLCSSTIPEKSYGSLDYILLFSLFEVTQPITQIKITQSQSTFGELISHQSIHTIATFGLIQIICSTSTCFDDGGNAALIFSLHNALSA